MLSININAYYALMSNPVSEEIKITIINVNPPYTTKTKTLPWLRERPHLLIINWNGGRREKRLNSDFTFLWQDHFLQLRLREVHI